jgi:hypothetical protein
MANGPPAPRKVYWEVILRCYPLLMLTSLFDVVSFPSSDERRCSESRVLGAHPIRHGVHHFDSCGASISSRREPLGTLSQGTMAGLLTLYHPL